MNDQFQWWLVLVGAVLGAAATWLLTARLPRDDDDVSDAERVAEAEWISSTIRAAGGVAPAPLVEEILSLHSAYLRGPALEPVATDEPVDPPPVAPPVAPPAAPRVTSPVTPPAPTAASQPPATGNATSARPSPQPDRG